MVKIAYTPAWKKFEKGIKDEDPAVSQHSADAFDEVRADEMRKDVTARKWETSRKESLAKDKPQWVKDRLKREKLPDPILKLKNFGEFSFNLWPSKGYLVIEVPPKKEEQTVSGIIIQREEQVDNIGIVLTVTSSSPCKVGQLILYKRGAGVEIKLKGKDCRLIQDSDVLGIFYE